MRFNATRKGSRMAHDAILPLLAIVLLAWTYATVNASASGFPGRIRQTGDSSNWWYNHSTSSDDEEGGISSSEEWELPDQPDTAFLSTYPPGRQQERRKSQSLDSQPRANEKPLRTLEKLQQMLDDTDYMTASAQRMDSNTREAQRPQNNSKRLQHVNDGEEVGRKGGGRFWTSKNRQKYKSKQQLPQRMNSSRNPASTMQTSDVRSQDNSLPRAPPLHEKSGVSSFQASEAETDLSDAGDGPGFTIPNLPIYLSDAEPDSDGGSHIESTSAMNAPSLDSSSQIESASEMNSVSPSMENRQLSPSSPDEGHQIHPTNPRQYPQGSTVAPGSYHNYPYPMLYRPGILPTGVPLQQPSPWLPPGLAYAPRGVVPRYNAIAGHATSEYLDSAIEQVDSLPFLAQSGSPFSFLSFLKMTACAAAAIGLCYASVSPRSLRMVEYNSQFYMSCRLALLSVIGPAVYFSVVHDPAQNEINDIISAFFASFTLGYIAIFCVQVLTTSLVRLLVFAVLEPRVFELSPDVPLPVLPWILRDRHFRPKRITLFLTDFIASCVFAPIVEESIKLLIFWIVFDLPKNFVFRKRVARSKGTNRLRPRIVAASIQKDQPWLPEVTNINNYIAGMLSVNIGIKLADSIRRICMYTKPHHKDKAFFALMRGLFPIREFCGTMTALALARRDILGQRTPLWKLLLPAVFVNGMTVFRGMKPIFKWNAATPCSEMQICFRAAERLEIGDVLPKVMWGIVLVRVAGYCAKNYFLVNRQARKRVTTYAGKEAAFSAELAVTEMLQKTKEK